MFIVPLYLVLKGSKKIFGAFGDEKHPIYPIFCVFIAFLGHFFSKNREKFLKMAPQAKFFQNFTQKGHIWCLKRLQNFVKIGKNVKIPLYLVLSGFKTPLYSRGARLKTVRGSTVPSSKLERTNSTYYILCMFVLVWAKCRRSQWSYF